MVHYYQKLCAMIMVCHLIAVAQVCEYREKKLGEMEALHRRFQEIVRKKDESIASLKESLAAAQLQLRGHAELLEQQRVELLG